MPASGAESSASCQRPVIITNSAVAGYVAGVTGVVLGHPLDSLKVWIQTGTTGNHSNTGSSSTSSTGTSSKRPLSSYATTTSTSPIHHWSTSTRLRTPHRMLVGSTTLRRMSCTMAMPATTRSTGWHMNMRALYAGISGPLMTVGLVQSLSFATYDATRRYLDNHNKDYDDHTPREDSSSSLINIACAGMVSGTALSLFTSPLIFVKTQQQVSGMSFRQAFTRLRVCAMWKTMGPHWVCESVGRAVYFSVYEAIKRQLSQYNHNHNNNNNNSHLLPLPDRMMAAGVAGVVCWSVIFPFDAVRNRLHSQATATKPNNTVSAVDMARRMMQERALYRGFSMTVLRAGPVAAIVLPVYEWVLEYQQQQPEQQQ